MPEGPLEGPRLTNLGPFSRQTKEELKEQWDICPSEERPSEICKTIKSGAIQVLEGQGFYAECSTLEDINGGFCTNIAFAVKRQLEYTTVLLTMGGDHYWIEYNGIHYDAEVPTGVTDPFDLPFFNRVPVSSVMDHARMEADATSMDPPESPDDLIIKSSEQNE